MYTISISEYHPTQSVWCHVEAFGIHEPPSPCSSISGRWNKSDNVIRHFYYCFFICFAALQLQHNNRRLIGNEEHSAWLELPIQCWQFVQGFCVFFFFPFSAYFFRYGSGDADKPQQRTCVCVLHDDYLHSPTAPSPCVQQTLCNWTNGKWIASWVRRRVRR